MNTIKTNEPDLSKVKLIDPATYGGSAPLVRFVKGKKSLPKPKHPASHLPGHLHHWVDMALGAVQPEYDEDGNLEGLTIHEARQVLTAALYILDTDKAPEFVTEGD